MSETPVTVSYHRQKSSTGRIRDGKIHLRISTMVSRREQERHIQDLTEKLKPHLEKHKTEKIPLTLKPLLKELVESGEAELLLSTGEMFHLKIKQAPIPKLKIHPFGFAQDGTKILFIMKPVERDFDLEEAEGALWKFLMKDQVRVLEERLYELREGWLKETFQTLRLRQVMSRWGSCDKKQGIIMLSVKLLLVEPKLLDYVCVHELAHLRHADHSDLFWNCVAEKMPDWKVQRKRLRKYE